MMNIIKMIVVNLELFRQFMENTLVSFYNKSFCYICYICNKYFLISNNQTH